MSISSFLTPMDNIAAGVFNSGKYGELQYLHVRPCIVQRAQRLLIIQNHWNILMPVLASKYVSSNIRSCSALIAFVTRMMLLSTLVKVL